MPGASFSSTARVASGVTSRAVRPVPPVVRTRSASPPSAHPASARGDAAGLVGHEQARGQRVSARLRPLRDRVAGARRRARRGYRHRKSVRIASRSVSGPSGRCPWSRTASLTTSAGIRSPRHSTSNLVPALAAAAGR